MAALRCMSNGMSHHGPLHGKMQTRQRRWTLLLFTLAAVVIGVACAQVESEGAGVQCQPMLTTHGLVIYNRIPKTGSTSMWTMQSRLASKNHFEITHSRNYMEVITAPSRRTEHLKVIERVWGELGECVATARTRRVLYENHMPYFDFSGDIFPTPHRAAPLETVPTFYVSQVRHAVDLYVSHYYYRIHGDEISHKNISAPTFAKARQDNLRVTGMNRLATVNEWVQKVHLTDTCDWRTNIMTRYFCGLTSSDCEDVCSARGLDRAQRNLARHYVLVSVIEDLDLSLALYEHLLPQWFHGAAQKVQHFLAQDGKSFYEKPTPATRQRLEFVLSSDMILWHTARRVLHAKAHQCGFNTTQGLL